MIRLTTLALSLAFAGSAVADGNVENGSKLSQEKICHTCHGADGNKTVDAQYPRLAGQYADYLAKTLREYRSGSRVNLVMAGIAKPLTDEEIDDLAAFYEQQKGDLDDLSHLK